MVTIRILLPLPEFFTNPIKTKLSNIKCWIKKVVENKEITIEKGNIEVWE